MNIYFSIAILLTIFLVILLIVNNLDTSYEGIIRQYNKLDDEGKKKADELIDMLIEEAEITREKRRLKVARIMASNKYLWIMFMFIAYRFFLNEIEREDFKKKMIEKYPHLRDAMENKKWPFN